MKSKNLHLRIDKDLLRVIKKRAAEEHTTQTKIIENALLEFTKVKKEIITEELLSGQDKILSILEEIKAAPILRLGFEPTKVEPAGPPAGPAKEKISILQRLRFWSK